MKTLNKVNSKLSLQNITKESLIGTWIPTRYTIVYSDNSSYDYEYETTKKNQLVFNSDNSIKLINTNTGIEKPGVWTIIDDALFISWGDIESNEFLFELNDHTLKKGSYFVNENPENEISRYMDFNSYERIA